MSLLCVRLGDRHRVAFTMVPFRATAVRVLVMVCVTLKLTIPMLLPWPSTMPFGPTLWRTTLRVREQLRVSSILDTTLRECLGRRWCLSSTNLCSARLLMHLTMTHGITMRLLLLLRMLLLALHMVMTPGLPKEVVDRVL